MHLPLSSLRRTVGRHRRVKRAAVALMLTLVTAIMSYAAVATVGPATPAKASSADGRAIAAGVDRFGNKYLFWQGTNGTLWEAYYNFYTSKWNGPTNLGMGILGSTPTVAIAPLQEFAGPGGNLFSGQYVYWEGQDGNLWMTYWNGSWQPAKDIGMGQLGSEPTASMSSNGEGQVTTNIFWEGGNANIWSTYSLSDAPTSASDYSAPSSASYNGKEIGPIGSSPDTSTAVSECLESICSQDDRVVWTGATGGLWYADYDLTTQTWATGPTRFSPAGEIGGPPSLAAQSYSKDFLYGWQGTNGYFWEEISGDAVSPQSFPAWGKLGSAPTVSEHYVGNNATALVSDIYWVGDSGNYGIWNADYTNQNGWVVTNLGMGPI
jgi:hypothetical protein